MILRILKTVVPILFLSAAGMAFWKMIESRPEAKTEERKIVVPLVRAGAVAKEDLLLSVKSQGTVSPRTVSEIAPEVSGKVTFVSPSLVAGGFFEPGDLLLTIERQDYELAVVRSEAEVAQARLRLEQERAEAEVAAREWQELGQTQSPSALVLRKPQVAQAEAALEAAKASLEMARRDLVRTEIRAPYAGRVRTENVDIGQYISRGVTVARIYAVDVAEVRLPLPDEELAYVDIPLSYRGDQNPQPRGPAVILKARFAGETHSWKGRIVRTEGEIATETRMVYVIAAVTDPYGHGNYPNRPPLSVGMFVEAEIEGRWLRNAVVLPRSAVRGSSEVYVVDSDNRLRRRDVEIYKREIENVIIRGGLEEGERVCLSPIDAFVDGMPVRVSSEGADS